MLSNIIDIITSNTWLLVLCIIIVLMLVIAIVKHFMKLFLVAVLLLAAYAGYLAYTGQKVPTTSEDIIQHGAEKLDEIKLNAIKKQIEETAKEAAEKAK